MVSRAFTDAERRAVISRSPAEDLEAEILPTLDEPGIGFGLYRSGTQLGLGLRATLPQVLQRLLQRRDLT